MKRLVKNGKIILDGTDPLYVKEEQALKKLEELEDIEEELGIDLITFMRILHQMDAQVFKPVEKIDKDWIATPYQNVRYSIDLKKKRLIEHGREKHVLKFKDYGKKWALTKEELL